MQHPVHELAIVYDVVGTSRPFNIVQGSRRVEAPRLADTAGKDQLELHTYNGTTSIHIMT